MINYSTLPQNEVQISNSEILDDSILTSGGGFSFAQDSLLLYILIRIDGFVTLNWIAPNDPQFYIQNSNSVGSFQSIQFFSNQSNAYFLIYPNPAIVNQSDISAGNSWTVNWFGSASYTPIGTKLYFRAYYLTQTQIP